MLKDDTMDYTAYTATIKRKRPTPRSSTKVGRVAQTRGYGSSDDDDDEDWMGRPRKLDFSGQKANGGGRITRQRLQVS